LGSVSGLTGVTIYNVFQNQGLRFAGVSDAAILASLAPVYMAVLARIILKEHISGRQTIGIIIAFIGSSLVATNGSLNFTGLVHIRLMGDLSRWINRHILGAI
jgi:drug/metabolite transporter (DMT)-like permease